MDKEILIREFSGRVIRKITIKDNGDKIVREFSGRVLGTYDSKQNVTREFSGRIIAIGDASGSL